jgi:hypothetical protein
MLEGDSSTVSNRLGFGAKGLRGRVDTLGWCAVLVAEAPCRHHPQAAMLLLHAVPQCLVLRLNSKCQGGRCSADAEGRR